MLIVSLISTGCTFFTAGQGDGEITTEARFERIQVHDFVQNRLVFEGTRDGKSSVYIYDMNEKSLTKRQSAVDWTSEKNRVHYLGDYGIVALKTGKGKDWLVLTGPNGDEKELVEAPAERSLQLSVAPDDDCLLYWTESAGESNIYIYDLQREQHQLVTRFSGRMTTDEVSWSGNGKYVMLKEQTVYRVPGGEEVLDFAGSDAAWSPVGDELLVLERDKDRGKLPKEIEKNYGHRIVKYDVLSGDKQQLFPVEKEAPEVTEEDLAQGIPLTEPLPLILGELVWDEQGRFFAFATGKVNGELLQYEKVHVMDVQGGFHHVENEQNLRPSSIEDMSFSPNSDFFSYTANGLLKVLYIPTQKSKIFDVYTQMRNGEDRYLTYTKNDAWVMGSHEIRRLSSGLEEKSVYRSMDELMQFFVAASGESILVIEREGDQYQLKLVSLEKEGEEKPENDDKG